MNFLLLNAFIVLAMSTIPCADGAVAMSKAKTEYKKQTINRVTIRPEMFTFLQLLMLYRLPIPQFISNVILVKPAVIRSYNPVYSSPIKEISCLSGSHPNWRNISHKAYSFICLNRHSCFIFTIRHF